MSAAMAARTSLKAALSLFRSEKDLNEDATESFLKNFAAALIAADVDVVVVKNLRDKIRAQVTQSRDTRLPHSKIKQNVEQTLMRSLVQILSPADGRKAFRPSKSKTSVVCFVGLQGAGKTTTCTKYARYWKSRGFRVGLVCADTYRAGAFDQLKQNASACNIPFYGSYSILDAAEIALRGVTEFAKQKLDLIIVDTSGRHKQEEELFEEMRAIEAAVKPDQTVFVVDSHIGQACAAQAKAFRDCVPLSSIIVSKLDGHAKGGGALSAVAATGCPVAFIGTGEGFQDFEEFDPHSYVCRLLGIADEGRLLKALKEQFGEQSDQKRKEQAKRMLGGKYTFADMRQQLSMMVNMGGVGDLAGMVASSMGAAGPQDADNTMTKIYRLLVAAIDSMTPEERSCAVPLCDSRKRRIARGAGVSLEMVDLLIAHHKSFGGLFGQIGKLNRRGGPGTMPPRGALPAMPQMGGAGGMNILQSLLGGAAPGNLGG